jgi:hypothetical protein
MTLEEADQVREAGTALATTSLTALLEAIANIFPTEERTDLCSATTMIAFAYIQVYLEMLTKGLKPHEKLVHDELVDIIRTEKAHLINECIERATH